MFSSVPGVDKFLSEFPSHLGGYRASLSENNNKESENSESQAEKISKFSKTLLMTPYGLTAEKNSKTLEEQSPIKKMKTKLFPDVKSVNNGDPELELKTENENDFTLDPIKDIEFGFEKPKHRAALAASHTYGKREKKMPEWQKKLAPEEVDRIQAFGCLNATTLLEKVKEIQNFAFQLGIEEQREMMRAKCLQIFPSGVAKINKSTKLSDEHCFFGERLGGLPMVGDEHGDDDKEEITVPISKSKSFVVLKDDISFA